MLLDVLQPLCLHTYASSGTELLPEFAKLLFAIGDILGGTLKHFFNPRGPIFLKIYKKSYRIGPHEQYILLDTIFNYIFDFGSPGKYL